MPYSSEESLILGFISGGRKSAPELQSALGKNLDWTYLSGVALQSGIIPFLYDRIKKLGMGDSLPPQVKREWKLIYHGAGLRNALLHGELKRVLVSFRDAGIPLIVLKGAALSAEVYGNVALRQMADIDLLVREQDLDRAAGELSALGYAPVEGYSEQWYRRHHHHLVPYLHRAKGVTVEIHRNIVSMESPFNLDIRAIWDRARHVDIQGVDALVLSPEDLIIHLCLHMSNANRFVGKIQTLIDISEGVKHFGERINWDWMVREAQERNFTDFLYYPLYLARETLGAQIDGRALDALRQGSRMGLFEDRLLKLVIKQNVFPKDSSLSIFPARVLRALCGELLREATPWSKTRALLKTVFEQDPRLPDSPPLPWLPGPSSAVVRVVTVLFKLFKAMSNILIHKARGKFRPENSTAGRRAAASAVDERWH